MGDVQYCRLNQIGEFSNPDFTPPSHIFTVTCSFVEMTQLLARRMVRSYGLQWKLFYSATFKSFSPSPKRDPYRVCTAAKVTAFYKLGTVALIVHVTNMTGSVLAMPRGILHESIGEKDGRIVPIPEMFEGYRDNTPEDGDAILTATKLTRTWTRRQRNWNQNEGSTLNALEYGKVKKSKCRSLIPFRFSLYFSCQQS